MLKMIDDQPAGCRKLAASGVNMLKMIAAGILFLGCLGTGVNAESASPKKLHYLAGNSSHPQETGGPAAGTEQGKPAGKVQIVIEPLKNKLSVYMDDQLYRQYPVALGKRSTPTPVGTWKVRNKMKNWGKGFGTRWIGLDVPWGIYGIHGTNRPNSIGRDVSHGCIRMFNQDVEELYEMVRHGTEVTILGHVLGEPHVEPRRLAAGDSGADVQYIQSRLQSAGFYQGSCHGKFLPSTELALKAFEKANGLPVDGIMSLHDYIALGIYE
jgi:lipoprotein-anchoring transpeptidase ErfK/SrfK